MDNESSTNPFANGASDEVPCQKGGLLLDLGTGNDGSSCKQNGKKTPELFFLDRPSNGKMTEDDDLGPETDVDAVDDVQLSPRNNNPFDVDVELHQEKLLDFDSIKEPRQETPTPPADEVTGVVGLVPDNVAESGEESEDEWNYYRVEPSENKTETESKQQTNLPVCEKPASLQGITVPSESADNMESQLNPNAAEFIPSPTQQRSIEQFLQSETAVEVDAELMPMPSKTEDGIIKVPFASGNFGSVSQSEKLPDLLNGQKNDYLPSDPCQLGDIGVGAPTTIGDSAEDVDFSDKMTVVSNTGNSSENEIPSALNYQGSFEKKCNFDISRDSPTHFEILPSKLISDSAGFPEFLDGHVNTDDITNMPIRVQESSESLLQELEPSSKGSESAAIAKLNQQKDLGVCLDQLQELTKEASELDVGSIANTTTDMEAHMPMLDQDLVENKSASSDNELNRLIDQVSDDATNLQDDASSFQPVDKAREPIHISFELQKDIAPEMESQPELVKLNGEDSSLSFDIQESVLEETLHEIDESVGVFPKTPVELDANSQQNLMDGSPRGDMASDHQACTMDTSTVNVTEMEHTPMSDAPELLQEKNLADRDELEPTVDVQPTLPSMSSPINESLPKLPEGDYEPLPPDHPLSVCVFPLDNIKDQQDNFGVSYGNEFNELQNESVTIVSGQENVSSIGIVQNQSETEPSSDIVEISPKLELESPIVTMTPPPTPLTVGIENVDVQCVLDATEKSTEVNKTVDSLQKEGSSDAGEVLAAAAVAAATATAATAVAVSADANLKKGDKKPAAKKPISEKTKTTTTTMSKTSVRSKPVPNKTVKSVPTSPTKPVSASAVPKLSPKKLPAIAPITKATKVQSPTTATSSVNRPKPNGLTSKPAPGLLKSRPSPGSSPATLTNNDAGKPSSKRPEAVGNKIGTGTLPASRIRPVSAPVPALKSSAKPAVSKTTITTTTTTRPSTASVNGSVNKSKVSSSLLSRPKTVAQSKVASVKEGKESVNKQISSSRSSNVKPSSASTVTRTVAQSSTRKVESKSVGNSASVTKTSTTTTTLKTATSKHGTKKPTSQSVTSSSSAKTKVSVSSENQESVNEVTSSVITSNEVKCDQAMFENAEITE